MIFGYVGICYKEAPLACAGRWRYSTQKKLIMGAAFCHWLKTVCDCLDLQPQRDFLFFSFGCGDGGAGAVLLPGHFPECFVWGLL